MTKPLNRLNNKDALEFDEVYKQFCKTGVWNMDDKEKAKKITRDAEELTEAAAKSIMEPTKVGVKGLMADRTGRKDRFPGSRDWDMEGKIDCLRKNCVANNDETHKCTMPSLVSIDEKGKCRGYKPRKKKKTDKEIWRDIL